MHLFYSEGCLRLGCRDGIPLAVERLSESGCERGIFDAPTVEIALDVSFGTRARRTIPTPETPVARGMAKRENPGDARVFEEGF
ncbi:hypothetical protein [Mesorhizobium sp. WSM4904]|uniref:hypothetical protein n=1 Tax=Mesorhizobium sp. WSM4904 TaxID=3038545 RepID=UPI002418B512|nr:hypothetical protein [Mesorhizobium sp. WSM4904]WFP61596.1 hypothetical protein QAZ47_24415 [Mesorhizobium sp. WSM4904]